ncbi:MAG: hypothetical protein HYX69_23020, partial [Planctomycetia bacterium]|nr:hypothetical protein [Planctomycetia bacterium]MBI2827557.1 hypothetical protein [Planctomycetia bacterium]
TNKNYALSAASLYAAAGARRASDGRDLGADITTLNTLTAGVILGT